ncbi:MAG TPA: FHA domain-containing protein [Polyangiaceae bacterium]|nr:FHA domain-containing protein [Polyangiaceae bacterium]
MSTMDETVQRPMGRVDEKRPTRARVQIVFPEALRASIPLGEGELVLGRKPGDRGHKLDDPTVSRRHLAVRWDPKASAHVALDLGSRNGSRVEGRRQALDADPRVIEDGDVIRMGDVLMVYERGTALDAGDSDAVDPEAIPGRAARTVQLRAAIATVAPDPSPVLLVGETGTGKEYVAREIHRLSGRKGPLIPVNCAALSPQLIESQLFGHKKGAFTGAQADHEGLFRAADGGTIFLDEIGELPRELQPKLLRTLQEGEVHPVGETKPVRVDVRVVSATLRDLAEMMEQGEFRLDLYARLSPFEVGVPALRDRRADILDWAERLHRRWHLHRDREPPPLGLDADAAERLLLHDWLDNLRGLDRLVHRLCSEPGSALDARVLLNTGSGIVLPKRGGVVDEPAGAPPEPAEPAAEKRPKPTKDELVAALEAHEGSVRATAKYYGRDRRQIYRWLDQYGLRES